MRSSPEKLKIGGEKSAEEIENSPWGKEYRESVPPFAGKNQLINNADDDTNETGTDDYYIHEGIEYRNVDKIDVSTERGKYEWLDSLVTNANARLENERENAASERELSELDYSLGFVKRQNKILENLDINGDGGVLGALERKRDSFAEIKDNVNASDKMREVATQNWQAATDLHSILSDEIVRRDSRRLS